MSSFGSTATRKVILQLLLKLTNEEISLNHIHSWMINRFILIKDNHDYCLRTLSPRGTPREGDKTRFRISCKRSGRNMEGHSFLVTLYPLSSCCLCNFGSVQVPTQYNGRYFTKNKTLATVIFCRKSSAEKILHVQYK